MPHRRPLKAPNLCVALLGLLLTAGPVIAQENRDPGDLLDDGRRAFESGEFRAAREDLWAYLDATANLSGAARLPQAEALYYIALMEPDASQAARHYQIIADEFPASSIADQAIFRLAQYELVQGQAVKATEWLTDLAQNYPYSRIQPEISLWIGRANLEADQPRDAAERFLEGFTRVKSQDLPVDLPTVQREALAAEYAWWLATAYRQAGDEGTAAQYLTLLTFDYPNSPQAAEAREFLASTGARPAGRPPEPVGEVAVGEPGAGEEVQAQEPRPVPREEPVVEEQPAAEPVREEPAREEPVREIEGGEEVAVQPMRPAPPPEPQPEPDRETPAQEPPVAEPAVEGAGAAGPPLVPGTVYVQVGAFTSASNAADLSKRLRADGFEPAVAVGIVEGRGFYRVRIGPFRLPEAAQRLAAVHSALISLGYPAQQVATD